MSLGMHAAKGHFQVFGSCQLYVYEHLIARTTIADGNVQTYTRRISARYK